MDFHHKPTEAPEPFVFDKPTTSAGPKKKLPFDYRWILITILLLVVTGMLALWQPWSDRSNNDETRTIRVDGQATVEAEPDQYTFMPSYTFANADRAAALAALTKKNKEVIDGLKQAGVRDNQIKTNANDYQGGVTEPAMSTTPGNPGQTSTMPSRTASYTLQLNISVTNKDTAQAIQNYLATTNPSGKITPEMTFSTKKRKELESQARDQATKEARGKAEQSARNLGFQLGNVRSVNDSNGLGGYPMPGTVRTMEAPASSGTQDTVMDGMPIQPGQNNLQYSVTVEYYLK